jgi:hypothetical protein
VDSVLAEFAQVTGWILRLAANEQPRFVILNEVKEPSGYYWQGNALMDPSRRSG